MFYAKVPIDKCGFDLLRGHVERNSFTFEERLFYRRAYPQCETHMLLRRETPLVTRFYKNPPIIPSSDADDIAKRSYAAFALGNFMPYTSESKFTKDLWSQYVIWTDSGTDPFHETSLRILQNIDDQARTRTRHTTAARLHRQICPSQIEETSESDALEQDESEETWSTNLYHLHPFHLNKPFVRTGVFVFQRFLVVPVTFMGGPYTTFLPKIL